MFYHEPVWVFGVAWRRTLGTGLLGHGPVFNAWPAKERLTRLALGDVWPNDSPADLTAEDGIKRRNGLIWLEKLVCLAGCFADHFKTGR